jgi:hypothetical protein
MKIQGISQSRSRQKLRNPQKSQKSLQVLISLDLGREVMDLHMAIETKLRNLDLDQEFSIVETKILKVLRFSRLSRSAFFLLRLRVSNETRLIQIETPSLQN